jgi:tetratricopeptide (TPR) repeat protein
MKKKTQDDLDGIRRLLNKGLGLSKQGSYQRRAPSQSAVPFLRQARCELEAWIEQNGEFVEALRLLALADEALLDYRSAVRCLEKVIALSGRNDRKDLKRLAACREASRMWRMLALNPDELRALGRYLRDKLLDSAPERSLRWTETWVSENRPIDKNEVLAGIQELGHFSDYQVLHNLVPG